MTRQYIGARYVPKFFENNGSTEWVQGVTYDALTIVTYLGNSFTSKIPVPANIGAPNENPTYWASTGTYNAQVEAYRQEVDSYRQEVDSYRQEVDSYTDELKNSYHFKSILSYGAIGDGIANDSDAFNRFINSSDKVVFIPAGTYRLDSAIDTISDKVFIGNNDTVLTGTYADTILIIPNEEFTINYNDTEHNGKTLLQISNNYVDKGRGYVKTNLRLVDKVLNKLDTLFHWTFLVHQENRSEADAENVAIYGKMDNYANGDNGTWALCLENTEYSEMPNPTHSRIGAEINLHGGGSDTNLMRCLLHLAYSKIQSSSGFNVGTGLLITGDNGVSNPSYGFDTGIKFQHCAGTKALAFDDAQFTRGIDLTNGNFSDSAISLNVNQVLSIGGQEIVSDGTQTVIRNKPTYISELKLGNAVTFDASGENYAGYVTINIGGNNYKIRLYR